MRGMKALALLAPALFSLSAAFSAASPAAHAAAAESGLPFVNLASPSRAAVFPSPLALEAARGPAFRLELGPITNRQWRSAVKLAGGIALSGQFDRFREPYVAVLLPNAEKPVFYKLTYNLPWGNLGALRAPGGTLALSISLKSTVEQSNHLVIEDGDGRILYDRPMRDLMIATVESGVPVQIKGVLYHVFFGNDIDPASGSPAAPSPEKVAAFVREYHLDGYREFRVYMVPACAITGRKPVFYPFFQDQPVGLSIDPAFETLEIYDEPLPAL